MNDWGDEIIAGPIGAGDAEAKCTKKGEMNPERIVNISSFQTYDDETEIESSSDRSITDEQKCTENGEMSLEKLDAARCSVEVKCTEKGEMSLEKVDAACCSVEEKEGDPIRYALAKHEQ